MYKTNPNSWIILLIIMTLVILGIVTTNVFFVSVNQVHVRSNTDLSLYAEGSNVVKSVEIASRGYIYDRNGEIIAQDVDTYNIVCILDDTRPAPDGMVAYVEDPVYTANILASILGGSEMELYALLTGDVYQTELGSIGRNISRTTMLEIESYNLPGIEFTESVQRSYPLNNFASYLIGYAQTDENGIPVGKMGVELSLNEDLTGENGYSEVQVDKYGYILPGMLEERVSAIDGNDVYLTLDKDIQEAMELAFEQTIADRDATKIWASVMEVDTGKILAWGQYPSFDPNELVIEDYNNYGSQYAYEAGSTVKVLAYAAAINEGNYDGSQLVDSATFCYTSVGTTPVRYYGDNPLGCISNARTNDWGMIEYDYGLILSSNSVTSSLITQVITPETYESYLEKFGLFQYVETDYIQEVTGTKNFTWPADKLSLSYGQGSSTTMLQLLKAFSAVFSDGTTKTPYFIESIKDSYDPSIVYYQAEVEIGEQVVSADTAKQVQELMKRVVYDDVGTARFYAVDGVEIIAKTGTSEIASYEGGYLEDQNITSVVVGLPADDPQYIIYYAFESDYSSMAHVETTAVQSLIQKVAMLTESTSTSATQLEDVDVYYEYDMPNLINNSLEYAYGLLEDISSNIYVLGNGTSIIDQYPTDSQTVYSNQRILLLTDMSSIAMPNMIGWTRKDVVEFWNISGIPFVIEGYGTVVYQSVSEGMLLNSSSSIEVLLE